MNIDACVLFVVSSQDLEEFVMAKDELSGADIKVRSPVQLGEL